MDKDKQVNLILSKEVLEVMLRRIFEKLPEDFILLKICDIQDDNLKLKLISKQWEALSWGDAIPCIEARIEPLLRLEFK